MTPLMTMPRSIRSLLLLLPFVFAVLATSTESRAQDEETPPRPEPKTEDVESIDAIIAALYDVISGPSTKERDWDRFRSLFVDDARLIPTARTTEDAVTLRVMSPDTYAERAAGFFKQPGGFFEREIGRKTHSFGTIAQIFSSYASFRENEEEPFMRGINSIQLFNSGKRWAIVSVFWDSERTDNPIPEEYLFESTAD